MTGRGEVSRAEGEEKRENEAGDGQFSRQHAQKISDMANPHRPLDPSLQLARDPFKEQKVPMNSQSAICQSPALCSAHADLHRDRPFYARAYKALANDPQPFS